MKLKGVCFERSPVTECSHHILCELFNLFGSLS
jgi:hypothetical protein